MVDFVCIFCYSIQKNSDGLLLLGRQNQILYVRHDTGLMKFGFFIFNDNRTAYPLL